MVHTNTFSSSNTSNKPNKLTPESANDDLNQHNDIVVEEGIAMGINTGLVKQKDDAIEEQNVHDKNENTINAQSKNNVQNKKHQTNITHKDSSAYFEVKDLAVSFGDTEVVHEFSLSLNQGDIGCLLGFSGCGKTTALRAIAGLEIPKSGMICLNNKKMTHIQNQKLTHNVAPAKRGMGMVFQDYALFSHLTVRENIDFGLHRWDKDKKTARVVEMLELVDLEDHADKRISELSGGQQQRVALARALAPKPELLLLDEPFSNLDVMLRESLAAKVREILKSTNTTAILVTHDQHEAFAIADKIGVMHQGGLIQWASPTELYHKPFSAFVAEFVGEGAIIKGTLNKNTIKTAIGEIHCTSPSECNGSNTSKEANGSNNSTEDTYNRCFNYPTDKQLECGCEIKVLIRPDDIILDETSLLKATIVGRVFRGANYLYQLQLDNKEQVLSLVSSHQDYQIGTKVGFKPVLEHIILFSNESATSDTWKRL